MPPLHCGHCMTLVESEKYVCQQCGCYLCPTHRRRESRLFFGSEYFCLAPCPTPTSTAPVPEAAEPAPPQQPVHSPPPPVVSGPPSASRLRGQTTALQTSFGIIQQQDPSPSRPSYMPPARWYTSDDGGEIQSMRQARPSPPPAAPIRPTHTSTPLEGPTEVYRHGTVTRRAHNNSGAQESATGYTPRSDSDVAVGTPVYPQSTTTNTNQSFKTGASQPTSSSFRMTSRTDTGSSSSASSNLTRSAPENGNEPRVSVARRLLPLHIPEPCDPKTGLREVHLSPDMKIYAQPEEKVRFLEVVYTRGAQANQLLRGTVLGTDNGVLVFLERGKRYAQRLLPQDGRTLSCFAASRCKHCGNAYPRDEVDDHLATHRKSGDGMESLTIVDNEQLGTACGDTALLKRLTRLKQLGCGAQGEVWLCRDGSFPIEEVKAHAKSQNPIGLFVVKSIACSSEQEAVLKYQQSVRLMSLEHVHLIRYLAVQRPMQRPTVRVVLPYYNEGDLAGVIRSARQPLNEHYVCSLILQIATALEFLHSRAPPVIHGDIKPENVLLYNRREQVVLMDLDASKELVGVDRTTTAVTVGTTEWMAPEALHHEKGTPRSDIWSLGLLAYVLTVLPDFPMLPCEVTKSEELLNSQSWAACPQEFQEKVNRAIRGRGYSGSLSRLILRMLSHEERQRPSAREAMELVIESMTKLLVVT